MLFCIFSKCHDARAFQIRKSLVITIRKRFADYFLHDICSAFFVKFLKRLVIHLSINEFNIHRHKTFPYKQIIIYYPSDAAMPGANWVGVFKERARLGAIGFLRIIVWERMGWFDYGDHYLLFFWVRRY